MTMGRRQNSVVPPKLPQMRPLKTFLTEGNRRNFFRKLRGGPQKTFANLFFSGQKALCLARFFDYSHQSLLIIYNYNRFIITATNAFVKKEKTDGEKINSVRFFGLVYEEILGIAKIMLLLRYRQRQRGELFLFSRGV